MSNLSFARIMYGANPDQGPTVSMRVPTQASQVAQTAGTLPQSLAVAATGVPAGTLLQRAWLALREWK